MFRYDITVSGSVQGIGYRYFVVSRAKALGITGWVKNLDTGEVKISAEGAQENLGDFITVIKTGHPWAHIGSIEIEKTEIEKKSAREFTIEF